MNSFKYTKSFGDNNKKKRDFEVAGLLNLAADRDRENQQAVTGIINRQNKALIFRGGPNTHKGR